MSILSTNDNQVSTRHLNVIALAWFMGGLGIAVLLTYPVIWLDHHFARQEPVWWHVPNAWAGPLLWLIGYGVTIVLWRRGLERLACGVGVGTLLIGLVIFASSM
jgi:cytochrome bd-type quinol oxidase subunit 2